MQQAVVEQALLNVAKQVEQQIDAELHKLENLQDDDIEALRQRRIQELRRQQEKSREWLAKGHGEYREIPGEKEFFAEMKGEERMICHFYRENWPCKVMDKHLAILAKKHIETKFVKINAEKSPFLVEKLKVWMLPTLALIKHEKTVDYVVGFDELGGKDDFPTEALAERLARVEMINDDGAARQRAAQQAPQTSIRAGFNNRTGSDEDSDFDE